MECVKNQNKIPKKWDRVKRFSLENKDNRKYHNAWYPEDSEVTDIFGSQARTLSSSCHRDTCSFTDRHSEQTLIALILYQCDCDCEPCIVLELWGGILCSLHYPKNIDHLHILLYLELTKK